MQAITTIRMTHELKSLVDATAAKCHLTMAEVLRAIAHGIRNGRPVPAVVDIEKMKTTTKSGSVVVGGFGGILIPEAMNSAALRRHIYLRCREELDRPEKSARCHVPQGIEGVDYNVSAGVAAAKLGIV